MCRSGGKKTICEARGLKFPVAGLGLKSTIDLCSLI